MNRFLPILSIIVGIILVFLAVFILFSSTPNTLPQAYWEAAICGFISFSLIIPSLIYLTCKFKQRYM
jgi:membrane protease YdiL (CAAX protease family)